MSRAGSSLRDWSARTTISTRWYYSSGCPRSGSSYAVHTERFVRHVHHYIGTRSSVLPLQGSRAKPLRLTSPNGRAAYGAGFVVWGGCHSCSVLFGFLASLSAGGLGNVGCGGDC